MTETFILNENGVCINPKTVSYKKDLCGFQIEKAYVDDQWIVGYKFAVHADGSSAGCSARWATFETEKEALEYAVEVALRFFNGKHRYATNTDGFVKVPKEIFAELNNILHPAPVQLSLFDLM